jgi:hypothetical protein
MANKVVEEFVGRLSPREVAEATERLLTIERQKTRSMAVQVASLLHSQLMFLKRPDLADFALFIQHEIGQ